MDASNKEVRFDLYCHKCKNYGTKEVEEPCNSCLEIGMRFGTEKPVEFVEDKK